MSTQNQNIFKTLKPVYSESNLSWRLETLHDGWLRYIYRDMAGSLDTLSTEDLMKKSHQRPINGIIEEKRLKWLGYAACRLAKSTVK